MVLQRASHDLAGRSRPGVYQDDDRQAFGDIAPEDRLGLVTDRFAACPAALRHDLAVGQEEVGQCHCLVERSARVGTQVEHETGQAARCLLLQVLPRGEDVAADIAGEFIDHYMADRAVLDLPGNRLELDQAARHIEVEGLVAAGTKHGEADRGAGLAAHAGNRFVEFEAVDQFAIEMGNVVARLDAGFVGRTAAEGRDDLNRAIFADNRQAETGIIAVDHRFEPLEVRSVEIAGMRVQRGQHTVDRAVDQDIVLDRLDITCLDALVDREQLAEFGPCAAFDARKPGGRCGDQRNGGHKCS